jgi:hypothetical protein
MRNSQELQQKCRRLQVVGNKKHRLVGAPRFELGTSCAQGRRPIQNKSSVFSVAAEKQQLSRDRRMWLAVYNCASVSVGWAQNWVHFLR